jgi:NCS1 family nucleobase:cation symporter-1
VDQTLNSAFERLNQLNEFERAPVTEDKLQGGLYFAGSFAGEHVAATEFVIGALFVSAGAKAFDVLAGLLVGNLLAVLTWTFICSPIAVKTRLTLYWHLRKIVGPGPLLIYNTVNGVMYCALGGAMITVAASAVRIPFGIEEQTKWYPEDLRFVLVVLAVGAVVVTLAVLGFKRLAEFATVCAPWMLLMFVAGGLLTMPLLGQVHSLADFWTIANEKIWQGPQPGQTNSLGFWHIVAFAWICNQGMHLGLTDMALLRYAKRASYGLYSSFGMLLGHYLAWICAGIMGAAAAIALGRPLIELDSGSVANVALGVIGALVVVIAGWTTANPMLYRAGLAFQVITPGWPRWKVTLLAGVVTSIIACFPFVFTGMLQFVAFYGLAIMPIGAVVVLEHWIFPKIGFKSYWVARKGALWNWPAMVAWLLPVTVGIYCWYQGWIHEFFLTVPVWLASFILYLVLAPLAGARDDLPELKDDAPVAAPSSSPSANATETDRNNVVYVVAGLVALTCLILCVFLPLQVFWGHTDGFDEQTASFKRVLPWITLIYFVGATLWIGERGRRNHEA